MSADAPRGMIVVGVEEVANGSSAAALEFAAREANRRRLPVKIVHGCAPHHQFGPISQSAQSDRVSRGRRIVDAAARRISKLTDPAIRVYVTNSLMGGVDLLVEESQKAALIVVQRRELGKVTRVSTGSVTSAVAARSNCPVVVVRDAHRRHAGSGLLVGVDGTGRSAYALSSAAELASQRRVPLIVVHAWDVPVPKHARVRICASDTGGKGVDARIGTSASRRGHRRTGGRLSRSRPAHPPRPRGTQGRLETPRPRSRDVVRELPQQDRSRLLCLGTGRRIADQYRPVSSPHHPGRRSTLSIQDPAAGRSTRRARLLSDRPTAARSAPSGSCFNCTTKVRWLSGLPAMTRAR